VPPSPSRLPTLLGPVTWSQSPLAHTIVLPFLAHSSLTGQHHGRFTHPKYLLTQHSQSLITVWPTISLFTCPSRSFILTFLLSCTPYHLSTHLPIYPLTHTPHPHNPPLSSSTSHQQIHFSKHARAKTYCLKYSLPPATLSLSLPRRRLGRTPLVAVLLFFSCRIRALTSFFIPCRWMRAMERLFFCLSSTSEVEARFVGPCVPNDEVDSAPHL